MENTSGFALVFRWAVATHALLALQSCFSASLLFAAPALKALFCLDTLFFFFRQLLLSSNAFSLTLLLLLYLLLLYQFTLMFHCLLFPCKFK